MKKQTNERINEQKKGQTKETRTKVQMNKQIAKND